LLLSISAAGRFGSESRDYRVYLIFSFRGRTLQDIIGIVAEETDEDETETAPVVEVVAPKTETEKGMILENGENLHARRMEILMKHVIQPLTPQEYNVANLIMQGLQRSEISNALNIKPESVGTYRNRIYSKFGIHKRQELFKLAESLDREWSEDEDN
jgi:DNA-binding CsgD family transcriptional regulator